MSGPSPPAPPKSATWTTRADNARPAGEHAPDEPAGAGKGPSASLPCVVRAAREPARSDQSKSDASILRVRVSCQSSGQLLRPRQSRNSFPTDTFSRGRPGLAVRVPAGPHNWFCCLGRARYPAVPADDDVTISRRDDVRSSKQVSCALTEILRIRFVARQPYLSRT